MDTAARPPPWPLPAKSPHKGGNPLRPIKLTDATDRRGCTTLHLRQIEFGPGGILLRVNNINYMLLISFVSKNEGLRAISKGGFSKSF
jgi:hypothetical protein